MCDGGLQAGKGRSGGNFAFIADPSRCVDIRYEFVKNFCRNRRTLLMIDVLTDVALDTAFAAGSRQQASGTALV
jgi:hypothetical protein